MYPPPGARPAEARPPGYHLHDGFYLRMGLGGGIMSSTFDYPSSSAQANMDVRGGGVGLDLWMGGTIVDGIVLGGALVANSADNAKDKKSDQTASLGQSMLLLFVDGFPSPTGGFDLGGGVGFASTSSPSSSQLHVPDTSGFGLGVWGGYTGWVSDNWSLGGLARFGLARTSASTSDGNVKSGSLSFVLEFTALYQ